MTHYESTSATTAASVSPAFLSSSVLQPVVPAIWPPQIVSLTKRPTRRASVAEKMVKVFNQASQFWLNYRNPIAIWLHRRGLKRGLVMLEDRSSGTRFQSTFEAVQMFGEVWHNRDYELPHIALQPGDVVIDIGGNQGAFACYAALQGAQVYSFEPFPESFQRLVDNLRRNHLENQVAAYPWALGAAEGMVEMSYSNMLGGGMNTIQPEFARQVKLECQGTISVPCFTLPQVMDRLHIQQVRLCKIDCEGSELDILKQLRPSDIGKIDAFVLEYHPAYALKDLLQLVLSWDTHQVSFADDAPHCMRNIVRVISKQALLNARDY